MPLSSPIDAYLEAARQKTQNQRNMYSDMAGIGQGLGQIGGSLADTIKAQKQKQLIQKLVQAMSTQGSPQQGPPLPGVGMTQGQPPPASGMGGPAQDNTQQMNALMMKANPQGMMEQLMAQNDPYKKALTQQALSEAEKNRRGVQQKPEWAAVSGMTTQGGQPLELDKFTGQMKAVNIPGGVKTTGFGSAMAGERARQFGINDLPSNQGPSTAGGAAYQVKVAARQGKSIIAKPGSPQQIALAAADLARAVQRSAPQMETLQGAGFSNNITTQINQLTQKITADPSGKDVPKIRKQIYDLLDDLDKTASPWIGNQLDTLSENGYPISAKERSRQMGMNIPEVQFQEGFTTPLSSGTSSGWAVVR